MLIGVGTSDGQIHVLSLAWQRCEHVIISAGRGMSIEEMHCVPQTKISTLCVLRNSEGTALIWDISLGTLVHAVAGPVNFVVCNVQIL